MWNVLLFKICRPLETAMENCNKYHSVFLNNSFVILQYTVPDCIGNLQNCKENHSQPSIIEIVFEVKEIFS